ncbi:MAG: DNA-3-methyladenine glycosylase I [Firmicutes bacterium]|nr:DNA-3-methyladenine glycosylase I [Bacillota bacterium]
MEKLRCEWLNMSNALYVKYHDEEWGVPVHDDRTLFEMLILEGAQAGLSWETILKKRDNYRHAFANFDAETIATYTEADVERLMQDAGIVRNRLKINATLLNARVFLEIQREFGTFDRYLWNFVNGVPIHNHFDTIKEIPAKTELSDRISKDLKKRGMKFVGSTIIYAYMQAVGLVNDHTKRCYHYKK